MAVDCLFVNHIICTLMCCTDDEVNKLVSLHFHDVPLFLNMNPNSLQQDNLVNNITLNGWTAIQKLAHMQRWQTATDFLSFTKEE